MAALGTSAPRCFLAICHVSCHRSFQTPLRKASIGFTCLRSHRIPVPLRRASTTSLLALSTIPEPIGQPARRKSGYCMKASRLRNYPRCSRTFFPALFGSVKRLARRMRGSGPRCSEHIETAFRKAWEGGSVTPLVFRSLKQRGPDALRREENPAYAPHRRDGFPQRTWTQSAPFITAQTSLSLDQVAVAGLHLSNRKKEPHRSGASNTRGFRRQYFSKIGWAVRNLSNCQGADLCPCAPH